MVSFSSSCLVLLSVLFYEWDSGIDLIEDSDCIVVNLGGIIW